MTDIHIDSPPPFEERELTASAASDQVQDILPGTFDDAIAVSDAVSRPGDMGNMSTDTTATVHPIADVPIGKSLTTAAIMAAAVPSVDSGLASDAGDRAGETEQSPLAPATSEAATGPFSGFLRRLTAKPDETRTNDISEVTARLLPEVDSDFSAGSKFLDGVKGDPIGTDTMDMATQMPTEVATDGLEAMAGATALSDATNSAAASSWKDWAIDSAKRVGSAISGYASSAQSWARENPEWAIAGGVAATALTGYGLYRWWNRETKSQKNEKRLKEAEEKVQRLTDTWKETASGLAKLQVRHGQLKQAHKELDSDVDSLWIGARRTDSRYEAQRAFNKETSDAVQNLLTRLDSPAGM